ncbi:Avr9/Cf-9 rapidly elicited protein [Trema orientale]|uniref:Avr9/Cf-9 rapidly elicited protein n=1 Tax=Trema orientale TaxID=63057 RepID=A0A2P5CJD3_TREOI|nr:Avr9/Cf-9 rapidly elicited protein [Trema orientale]
MNSIFSCFDVLCADLVFGKTSLLASSSSISSLMSSNKAVDHSNVMIGKQDRKSPSPVSTDEKKEKKKQIRSAPEFDGLNCFETFVSY